MGISANWVTALEKKTYDITPKEARFSMQPNENWRIYRKQKEIASKQARYEMLLFNSYTLQLLKVFEFTQSSALYTGFCEIK